MYTILFDLGDQVPKRGLLILFLLHFIIESNSVMIIRYNPLNAVFGKLLLTLIHAYNINAFLALRQHLMSVLHIRIRQIHHGKAGHAEFLLELNEERNSFPEENLFDPFFRCIIIYFAQCDLIIHFYLCQLRFYHNNLSSTTGPRVALLSQHLMRRRMRLMLTNTYPITDSVKMS